MLRLRDGQTELFDALMPPDARVLSTELAKVGEQLAILFLWRGGGRHGQALGHLPTSCPPYTTTS